MGLIELVRECGALTVARTLIEGTFSRSYGGNVTGKLAVNAKALGYTCARAGGLAELWLALSRFEEADIAAATVELLEGETFAGAVTELIGARCRAAAAEFLPLLRARACGAVAA